MAPKRNVGKYIGLSQPVILRKEILETAIKSALALKHFDAYKIIKVEKVKKIDKIKLVMKKIIREINALNASLPSLDKKIEIPKTKSKQVRKKTIEKKGIEKDIEDIRRKLDNLDF
jgi:hypothetical protein